MKNKTIALHIIMPNQVSGPNTANKRMAQSWLKNEYDFHFVTQTFHANSKINIALIKDLKSQFERIQPDIVHLSGLQSSGFHAVVAARLAGCDKIIVAIRGFSGDAIGIGKLKKFIFTKIIEPLTLKLCYKFYTVCTEASNKKMVQKNKSKYIGVIHNAAPKIDIDISQSRRKTRKDLGVDENDFLVVVSGRMVFDKGISFIIDAIEKLNDQRIKFVFVGDGEYCDILRNKYQHLLLCNKIHVLGQRSDVLTILAGCDLFLFATLHENLSNSLLEAMAIGLPIIATKVGGNTEVVRDGINGYLIPAKNSDEIVKCIMKIKSDDELRMKFSQQSLNIIQENFSQERLYQSIAELYKNI
ncbi:glycosyltransferase family 4 protein [Clostridium tunisiense]|uniref:glycosyltransferase family 4 protein n=1 Tax=Clostridium tunisiense TaxID=219748 RepID=UPI0002F1D11C|nr:glycosyltransferase family 4 protein [Clostridium tunisiense]